jgi:hypothetical protein
MKCPVCESDEVTRTFEKRIFNVKYGPPVEVEIRIDKCSLCLESGDFEHLNDRSIQQALEISALRSVPNMVERLQREHNCVPPYIERVTGLPQGSIMRCLAGHYDAAVIIALRMALTYPPILRLLDAAGS